MSAKKNLRAFVRCVHSDEKSVNIISMIIVIIVVFSFLSTYYLYLEMKPSDSYRPGSKDDFRWGINYYHLEVMAPARGAYQLIVPIGFNHTVDYHDIADYSENLSQFSMVLCEDILKEFSNRSPYYSMGLKMYFNGSFTFRFRTYAWFHLSLEKESGSVKSSRMYYCYFQSDENSTAEVRLCRGSDWWMYETEPEFQNLENGWNTITLVEYSWTS